MNSDRPTISPFSGLTGRILLGMLAVGLVAVGLIAVNESYRRAELPSAPPADGSGSQSVQIGAPFDLIDHRGQPVSDRSFAGRKRLMIFAAASDRDRILAALQVINSARDLLGPAQADVAALWITTDPVNDTPEKMSAVLAEARTKSWTGLTGPDAAVRALMRAFFIPPPGTTADTGTAKGVPPVPQVTAYLMDEHGGFLSHRTVPPDPTAFAQWLAQSL